MLLNRGTEPQPVSAERDRARLDRLRERSRERGVNVVVYWVVRAVLQPALHVYFRLRRISREHIPADGPVILAANHRSFLDPFVIGCCLRRPVHFVAKRELFERRLQGWLLNALGAFPIRRGESDEDSMATAKAILARGDVVVIFPEGTRIRSGSLGPAKRGVGRLALETRAPVVPIAVKGTERARRGWLIRPVKVSVRCGRPLTFPHVDSASPALAREVTARIWPCVELQWEWLGGLPPLRKAAVVGAGSMGTAMASLLARAGLDVQLAARNADAAQRVAAHGVGDGVAVTSVSEIEFAGVDLIVFAVPAAALPSAVAKIGDRVGQRSAVVVVSKGLVPPLGTLPVQYVAERVGARAVAALGGPCHAREAVELGASVVVAAASADFRRQLADVLEQAGLEVEPTADVAGVELAGCAKNAAALAAAAAAASGMNAAGVAGAHVFGELELVATRLGAEPATFRGVAGVGDLVATVMAPHSRNRRAGELLAAGVAAGEVEAGVGATAEAIASVPLLAQLASRAGVPAPATVALAELVTGRLAPEHWVAGIRAADRRGQRPAA
jgi:glycerol-3-phosphate dehydrogenase (NAD(P)+)